MLPEEVALKYARRPGFRLVSFAEVALPVFRLNLTVLALDRKPLLPIEEFVLKCVNAGLASVPDIASLLGMTESVIEGAATNLIVGEHLTLGGSPGQVEQRLDLTTKGRAALNSAEEIVAGEVAVSVEFDRLTWEMQLYSPTYLVRPRQARSMGLVDLAPPVARRPELRDLKLEQLNRLLQSSSRPIDTRRDVLAIKSVDRAERYYIPAVALAYRALGSDDVSVAFVIDAKPSEAHEKAFAQAGGPDKTGIAASMLAAEPGMDIEQILELGLARGSGAAEIVSGHDDLGAAYLELAEAERASRSAETREQRERAETEVLRREEELEAKIRALILGQVTYLAVHDHPPLLRSAIESARERLMIISPWVRAQVVDGAFLKTLENRLHAGVRVYVGYGLGEASQERRKEDDRKAEAKLSALAAKYDNFVLKRFGDTHAKVLIKDHEYAVVTSFNWLSFRGDPTRTFREEEGILVGIEEKVDEKFEQHLRRFD